MDMAACGNFTSIIKAEREKRNRNESLKAECKNGMKMGVAHGLPMLVSFTVAQLGLSNQSFEIGNLALAAACLVQFIGPVAMLAYAKQELHENTIKMLWTAIIFAGITNGVIFSYLLG